MSILNSKQYKMTRKKKIINTIKKKSATMGIRAQEEHKKEVDNWKKAFANESIIWQASD